MTRKQKAWLSWGAIIIPIGLALFGFSYNTSMKVEKNATKIEMEINGRHEQKVDFNHRFDRQDRKIDRIDSKIDDILEKL